MKIYKWFIFKHLKFMLYSFKNESELPKVKYLFKNEKIKVIKYY